METRVNLEGQQQMPESAYSKSSSRSRSNLLTKDLKPSILLLNGTLRRKAHMGTKTILFKNRLYTVNYMTGLKYKLNRTKIFFQLIARKRLKKVKNKIIDYRPFLLPYIWIVIKVESPAPCLSFTELGFMAHGIIKDMYLLNYARVGENNPFISHWRSASIFYLPRTNLTPTETMYVIQSKLIFCIITTH